VDLDARLTSWLHTRTGAIEGRTVIAVDGKTMRGARTGTDPAPHLLAALDQAAGTVLTQRRVADKSNEIPALPELLAPMDLDGALITADATAHPDRHGRVDPQPRRPLPPDGQGEPEDPAQNAQGPALEGRADHLRPRRLPRAAGATHPQSRPGPPVGGLPRRRTSDPGSDAPAPSTNAAAVPARTTPTPPNPSRTTTPIPGPGPPSLVRKAQYYDGPPP